MVIYSIPFCTPKGSKRYRIAKIDASKELSSDQNTHDIQEFLSHRRPKDSKRHRIADRRQ